MSIRHFNGRDSLSEAKRERLMSGGFVYQDAFGGVHYEYRRWRVDFRVGVKYRWAIVRYLTNGGRGNKSIQIQLWLS